MKTKTGHYYVFFTIEDFWNKVNYWKSKGYYWLQESHPSYNPTLNEYDLLCVLSVDDYKTMLHGVVNFDKERYFRSELFVKIYTTELRKHKLRKINKKCYET